MFWLTVVTTALTFLLLLVGGIVHATGSGLACPDWSFVPMCFGQVFPEMTGGVLFEHGHRMFASVVGMLTIAMVVVAARAPTRRAHPRALKLAIAALVLVCLQGTLGGLTVLLKLPWYVSTAHLGTSMLFFALLIHIAWTVRPDAARPVPVPGVGGVVRAATVAVYAQIVLGAAVRHLGAGLACLDVPLCTGYAWPPGHPLGQLQMAHRFLGVVVALVVAYAAWRVIRAGATGWTRRIAFAAPVLVLAQIALGVYSVWTHLGILQVTAHLAFAALIWGAMLFLVHASPAVAREPSRNRGGARDYVALIKPRITVLSVLTAAGGYALAPGFLDAGAFAALVVGVTCLVGAANTLNMVIEREADARMARTRNRPLPAGRLAPRPAMWFGLAQLAVALPVLALGNNLLTAWLGALSFVLYVLVYTPLKQRTTFALLVGAVPGAAPPLLGWTAATGEVAMAALALFAVIFVWQVPHFLAIALYRRDDYVAADMKILPAVLGDDATKRTIVSYLLLQFLVTVFLVPLGVGGTGYLIGAALLGAGMLGLGLAGLRPGAGVRWARQFFFATLVYLPALFGLMFL